jgi:hypothetical protein
MKRTSKSRHQPAVHLPAAHSMFRFRQTMNRGQNERTMIGHDDAVHACVHRRMCVFHRLHALHHERPIPVLAQERKVHSRPKLTRGHFLQPPAAKLQCRHRLSSLTVSCSRNASWSNGKAGRSSGRTGRPMRCMKTGAEVPTWAPTAAAKGR